MDDHSKAASLVYEVCFGAVFKYGAASQRMTLVSKRDRDHRRWLDAHDIEDHAHVYDDLGDDQFAIVQIESKGDVVRLRDMFRAALTADGDTGTIARAIHDKSLGVILEEALTDWMKKSGPILQHESGKETYIWPDELTARYDNKDLPLLRRAYEDELKEDAEPERLPMLDEAVARFNKFVDRINPETDELYWFEHNEIMADRIGYVIMRAGRAVGAHLVMMS